MKSTGIHPWEMQKQNPGVPIFLLAYMLLWLLLEFTSCSHSTILQSKQSTLNPKDTVGKSHILHTQQGRSRTIFYLVNMFVLMTSPHLHQAFICLVRGVIWFIPVARNFSVFLWQQFTHPLTFSHIFLKWWSSTFKCPFLILFLNPIHTDCLPDEIRSSHLGFLPHLTSHWWLRPASTTMQGWCPGHIDLSKSGP